jgi:hypothetical protein
VKWRRRQPGPGSLEQSAIRPEFATRPDSVAWTPSTWTLHHPHPSRLFPDVSPDTLARCARRSILLASHRGVVPKPTTDRGNILLSVRTTLKITSAVAAGLAFSLAGAGTALADEIGADASGGGDVGFGVSGPTLPPPPPLPAPTASASGGTGVGLDTPLGSADGGLSTDWGIGLPTPPPPPALPAPTASASGGTGVGVDTPLGSGEGGFATDVGVGLPTLPPPPPPPSASGSARTNLGFGF